MASALAIARMVFGFLFGTTMGRYILIAVGAAAAFFWVQRSAYNEGWNDAIAKVEAQQRAAIELALKAREHLRDACLRNSANCVPDDWFRD